MLSIKSLSSTPSFISFFNTHIYAWATPTHTHNYYFPNFTPLYPHVDKILNPRPPSQISYQTLNVFSGTYPTKKRTDIGCQMKPVGKERKKQTFMQKQAYILGQTTYLILLLLFLLLSLGLLSSLCLSLLRRSCRGDFSRCFTFLNSFSFEYGCHILHGFCIVSS